MQPGAGHFCKRVMDLAVGGCVFVLAIPVMALVALVIRLTLGRPVFFRQIRPGLNGRPFGLHKFRTMTDARNGEGRLLPDEARLTAFGRFLRSTSLDELPELWNVLRGDMSLVGPRPLLMAYLERYDSEQMRRHHVKPGLTGWAQVNGRNALTWEDKFRLDVWYVDNRNLVLDLKILFMTLGIVLRREGISQEGHCTAEEFRGNRHED
ncbi:MAG: UDP-galactose phosphate transferase [Deltaproteobacteria bacterium HGW-Deltaproteobacteria-19]|nr:MAG: UDP-galactose phosphate transferase [Deltaproteobacteria bacterium HGW-Deltaproteobacteria-19]